MLVLSRRVDEAIVLKLGETEVWLMVRSMEDGNVKLCFDAPRHVEIYREEVRNRRLAEKMTRKHETDLQSSR